MFSYLYILISYRAVVTVVKQGRNFRFTSLFFGPQ